MYINEKVFLFSNTTEKYKNFIKKIEEWESKIEKIITYTAKEIIGIQDQTFEDQIWISTNGDILISDEIVNNYNLQNKVSKNYSLRYINEKCVGVWNLFKKNTKEYKTLFKYIQDINLGIEPDERVHFLNNHRKHRIGCKIVHLKKYGWFFVIQNNYLEDDKLLTALSEAKELKLSEFYNILESEENGNEVEE